MGYKILSDGIRIDSIDIAKAKIDGLYLKLDKKLILEIASLDLRGLDSTKNANENDISKPKIKDIADYIQWAVRIGALFSKLEVSNILHGAESSSIYFDGNRYKINLPHILVDFSLENDGDDLLLDIASLQVKQEDLMVKGRILYLRDGDMFAFDLESYINKKSDNVISYQGESNFKYLNIVLDSTNLASIDILAPYIRILDKDVHEWMFLRSTFESVAIERAYLYTENLDFENIDKVVNDNLYAIGVLKNAKIRFEDELPSVESSEIKVEFNRGKLSFWTQNANYDGILVDEGIVHISDFFAPQTLLELQINSKKARLEEKLLHLLNHYGISIPLMQKSGFASGFVNLNILLPTKNLETKVTPSGKFDIKNSIVNLGGMDVLIDSAKLEIGENNILLDSKIRLSDILNANLGLNLDINKQSAMLELTPSYFKFNDFVRLNKRKISSNMDFSGEIFMMNIEDFGQVSVDSSVDINIDIARIYPIAPILQRLALRDGNLGVKIDENIELSANLANLNYPLYNLNKTQIKTMNLKGKLEDSALILDDVKNQFGLKAGFESGDIDLKFGRVFVNINEILDSKIPIFKEMFEDSKSTQQDSAPNIFINGNNVSLGLFGYDLNFNEAMLKTTQNSFIANGKNGNGIANLILDNGRISVEGNNFSSDFINSVFKKEVVSGGSFGVFGIYRDQKFVGDISMLNTSVKNMASLQNILALIDAIPSLVMFKLPGFSASGYEIQEANIRMGLDGNYIALENIDINGSSVDIGGKGIIDLQKNDMNINLNVSTMKSLSSIINKIPIVGFILLGEDGKITTELTIKGTMENPKTELSLLEDTAKAPLDMLMRIFSPFEMLVEELKKENTRRRRR